VAQGVPGRLRPRIVSTFGTTRVVGRQPNAPAAFTPREIPGTHFQRLSRPQGTWFCGKEPREKSHVTPLGIDPGTARLVAQRLNHYATPGPDCLSILDSKWKISIVTLLLAFPYLSPVSSTPLALHNHCQSQEFLQDFDLGTACKVLAVLFCINKSLLFLACIICI
jgi:hypothetical protein